MATINPETLLSALQELQDNAHAYRTTRAVVTHSDTLDLLSHVHWHSREEALREIATLVRRMAKGKD